MDAMLSSVCIIDSPLKLLSGMERLRKSIKYPSLWVQSLIIPYTALAYYTTENGVISSV